MTEMRSSFLEEHGDSDRVAAMSPVKKVVFLVALLFVRWCWSNRADS